MLRGLLVKIILNPCWNNRLWLLIYLAESIFIQSDCTHRILLCLKIANHIMCFLCNWAAIATEIAERPVSNCLLGQENTTSYLHTCCKCDYRWKSHSTHIPMLINGCKRCRLWLFEDLKVKAKGTLNTTICIYNETKSEKLIAGIVVAASEVVHLPTCTCKLSCNERNNRLTRVSSSSLWSNYWMNEQDDVWS